MVCSVCVVDHQWIGLGIEFCECPSTVWVTGRCFDPWWDVMGEEGENPSRLGRGVILERVFAGRCEGLSWGRLEYEFVVSSNGVVIVMTRPIGISLRQEYSICL